MLKGPKHCMDLHGSIFLIFLISLKGNQLKNFVLVVSLILRLFFNILSPDNKYSLSVKTTG